MKRQKAELEALNAKLADIESLTNSKVLRYVVPNVLANYSENEYRKLKKGISCHSSPT